MGIMSSQLLNLSHHVDGDGDGDGDDKQANPEMSPARIYDHGADTHRAFGPPMSPLPGDDDEDAGQGLNETNDPQPNPPGKTKQKKRRKSIDSTANAASDNNNEQPRDQKKKSKKSRKKPVGQEEHTAQDKNKQPNAPDVLDAEKNDALPKRKSKKKSGKNATQNPEGVDTTDANDPVSSSAQADQSLSASEPQQLSQPDIMRRPSNQSQNSLLNASQIKTEEPSNDDEEVSVQLSGSSVIEEDTSNGGDNDMGWLHKRGEDDLNSAALAAETRGAYLEIVDEALPDLLPSQIKPEHQLDTDSDSDAPSNSNSRSGSPSAERADRLDKSRSRSASKASASQGEGQILTNEVLLLSPSSASRPELVEMSSRTSTPYSGRSSTGSDRSIPPQIESQPASHPLEPSEQRPNDESRNGASDTNNGVENATDRRTHRQARRTRTNNEKTSDLADNTQTIATVSSQASPGQFKKQVKSARKKAPGSQSNGPASDRDIQAMADWLEGNGRGDQTPQSTTHSENHISQDRDLHDVMNGNEGATELGDPVSLLKQPSRVSINGLRAGDPKRQEAGDADAAPSSSYEAPPATIPQSSTKKRRPKSSFLETEAVVEPQEAVAATAENETAKIHSVEPEESASQPQPKGKRKRKLQPKNSLSLSQLEGDDPDEGESRLSTFSQKSKRKDMMRVGSNEPDQSEIGALREPSLPPQQPRKPRKPRKKRRTDNEGSEDELENLLAAGPSKTRKRVGKLDHSDEEHIRAAKRKRLSKKLGGAATGPWTAEELKLIKNLYEEFRDVNGMTGQELNDMIHERPDKVNELQQEFWNRADVIIPQRTRKQIVERTRRLYNNFTARGTWTDKQKDEVHELYEKYGKKFSVIAGLINRDQKDVRDYWRNHYLVHETQIKRRWAKEEEARLIEVVEEALAKIRIQRENSGELRTRPRAAGDDDESLLDWHQISEGMDLTRSRVQCKWKWTDMREKGLAGDGGSRPPTQAPSSANGSGRRITDISDELAQAREGFDKMTNEDKRQLVEAIHDSKATDDANIPWPRLVNNQFRAKWMRPTLKLAWYRLRRSVPDYDENTVEDNARYLLNHVNNFEDFPLIREGHIDDLGEEKLIHGGPGNRLWKRPSQDLKAIAQRQRRVNKRRRNSEHTDEGIVRWLRDNSVDLGDDDDEEEEIGDNENVRGSRKNVPIRVPSHLKGEAAKQALAEARAKANVKTSKKSKEPARGMRSASVAVDSDSE